MCKEKYHQLILAIDTSCDETSVAVLRGRKVLSSIIASQVDIHKKWGGVVPDLARRAHEDNIDQACKEALHRARINLAEIEYIAVTIGPGLAIALEVGLKYGQKLAHDNNIGFLPINHMEGHLLSSFALNSKGHGSLEKYNKDDIFPAIAVLISGGRTQLVLVSDFGSYNVIGETLDDAIGEAFDKVAKMLGFGYPGGPIITYIASQAKRDHDATKRQTFGLPVPMQHSDDLNFSYSGLKTACLYKIRNLKSGLLQGDMQDDKDLNSDDADKFNNVDKLSQADASHKWGRQNCVTNSKWVPDFCLEFLNVATKSLTIKLVKALNIYSVNSVLIGGGVTNSEFIVRALGRTTREGGAKFFYPEKRFRADNAGMIGVAAYYNLQNGVSGLYGDEIMKVDRNPSLTL